MRRFDPPADVVRPSPPTAEPLRGPSALPAIRGARMRRSVVGGGLDVPLPLPDGTIVTIVVAEQVRP